MWSGLSEFENVTLGHRDFVAQTFSSAKPVSKQVTESHPVDDAAVYHYLHLLISRIAPRQAYVECFQSGLKYTTCYSLNLPV